MTPAARLQAAIEVLDEVIASVRDDGPPADAIVTRYFKTRRYAGSKDRRAVRELVFLAIRLFGEPPTSGTAAFAGLARYDKPTRRFSRRVLGTEMGGLSDCFDGSAHGPPPIEQAEWMRPVPFAGWATSEVLKQLGRNDDELWALLRRAPLDLRVNIARTTREEVLPQFDNARTTPFSPWGIRLPADSRVDDHPAFESGSVEVQDEGSQLIALACEGRDGECIVDLCAGAGGKSLALAASAPGAHIFATDSNRARLSKLAPRAERAGAAIETRLLNPPNELADLADWHGNADLVLVDAPCSGSGTWRRNPDGRWRLTPERLDRVIAVQARLLDIAAELVRPGGRLVYAVCSLLSREGAGQIEGFLIRRSSWQVQETPIAAGRLEGAGRLLTPAHDGTDGFFVARLQRPC